MTGSATRTSARADLEAGLPPEQLVPGDLVALDDAVLNCQALGDQLAATARSIQYIELNGTDWTGGSRLAYDWVQDVDIRSFKDAAGVFDDVVATLAGYASALEGARGEAQVALTNYQRGKAQQAAAVSNCLPIPSASAPPLSPSSIFDTDPYGIDGAVTKLLHARHSVELAGAEAAKSLRALADLAPQPHRPTVKDNLKNSVNGFFDPVVKLVRSPYDAFNNCSDYLSGFGHGSECAGDLGKAGVLVGLLATEGRAAEDDPFGGVGSSAAARTISAHPSALERTGSALSRSDPFHRSVSWVVDNPDAQRFVSMGGDGVPRDLFQLPGELNGKLGVFEWIIDRSGSDPVITHQRFIPGGSVTGYPNQVVR